MTRLICLSFPPNWSHDYNIGCMKEEKEAMYVMIICVNIFVRLLKLFDSNIVYGGYRIM